MSFVIYIPKLENVGTKMFLQIYKILSNFDFNSLICVPTLFPGKNIPNTAKSNRVFPGKGIRDRALILTRLDSPMAEVSLHYDLSFSILVIFKGKRVVKVGPKVQTLGPSLFHESLNPSSFFQTMFLCARIVPLVRISTTLNHICGSKGSKTFQKEPCHGC